MNARRWSVVAATAGAGALRLALGFGMESPFLFYDEGSAPAIARWLSGGTPHLYGSTGNPLLGAVLAPVAAVESDPETLYRAALILNACAFAALLPVLYVIGRQVLGYRHGPALVGAGLGSAVASTIAYSVMLLPEALLTLAAAIAVLCIHRALCNRFTGRWAIAAVVSTILAFAAHPRGLVLALALAVIVAASGRSGGIDRRVAVVTLLSLAGSVALVGAVAAAINGQIYVGTPPSSIAGSLVDGLVSPALTLRSLVGTTWYLVASTWGVIAVATVGLVRRSLGPESAIHRFVVLAFAGSLGLSALFVGQAMSSDGARVDTFAYGRYVEFLVPIVLVYAPLAWSSRPMSAIGFGSAAAVAALGTLVAARAYDRWYWFGPSAQHNQSGLHWARPVQSVLDPTAIAPLVFGGVALLAMLALVFGDVRLLTIPMVIGLVSGTIFVSDWARPASSAAHQRLAPARFLQAEGAVDVAAPIDRFDPTTLHLLAFWAPLVDFDPVLEVARIGEDAQWILQDPGRDQPREGFEKVLEDTEAGVEIWRVAPGPPPRTERFNGGPTTAGISLGPCC